VQERYPNFLGYRHAVIQAVDDLVGERLMLCEDVASAITRLVGAGQAAGVPAPGPRVAPRTTVPNCARP
jgi:hypothetical protein